MKQFILALFVKLAHKGLGSVKQHALLESFCPQHLHLDNKLTVLHVAASHIYYTVLAYISVGHKFGREILHTLDLLVVSQWQQSIKKTDEQVLMLAEYLFESKVGFGSRYLIMEKYLRVDDCDYILYVANLLIIIEIYDKKY